MSKRTRGGKPPARPTMADVGRLAGVSTATVSFVINEQPDQTISDATRQRVLTAVEQLGYRPNPAAQSLRTKRTRTVGLITDNITWPAPAGRMIAGAHEVADAHNCVLLIMDATRESARILEVMDELESRTVDAIIYAVVGTTDIDLPAPRRRTPTVLMNGFHAGIQRCVVPDERQGQAAATRHLLANKHTRIVYLAGHRAAWATKQRRQGFRQAVKGTDVRYAADMIRYGNFRSDSGYELARAALIGPDRPTALMCGNDLMAIGAYFAAKELGLRIPDDVSIIGYDDHDDIAEYTHPPLSTVRLPYQEMGRVATTLSIAPTEIAAGSPHFVDCELISRDSVGAADRSVAT